MIKVVKYESLEECMAAHWGETPEEVIHGKCVWTNGKREHHWPMRRFIRSCKKQGVWGYCQKGKGRIHAWVADHAKPESVVRFFAHEIGHMQRPYKRDHSQEEAKAEKYADVAKLAFEMMESFIGGESEIK